MYLLEDLHKIILVVDVEILSNYYSIGRCITSCCTFADRLHYDYLHGVTPCCLVLVHVLDVIKPNLQSFYITRP